MSLTASLSPPLEAPNSFAVQQWMLEIDRMLRSTGALSWSLLDLTGSDINALGGTPLTVANGGTGRTTSTTAYGLIAAGTTATGAHQTLPAGLTTEILVGGGASALPVWTTATGSGAPVRATSPSLVTPNIGAASGTSLSVTGQLSSTVVTGTAPLSVASTTKVTNLNADLLDDQSGAYYLDSANFTGTNWTDLTDGGTTTLHTHTSGIASSITLVDAAGDTTTWVVLGTSQTGNVNPATDAGLTYNATTDALTATTFVGALSGNATTATTLQTPRTIGGTSFNGSADIVPSLITVAGEAVDTTCNMLFATATTGDLQPKTHANMTFNAATGVVTFASSVLTSADINGGTIDGTAIGGAVTAAGAFTTVSASGQITSTVSTGTAPIVVASTTKVTNLNADSLDDQSGAYYLDSANFTGTNWTDLTDTGATTLHKHDHGGMDGLADDDHTIYWTAARGAARVSLRI